MPMKKRRAHNWEKLYAVPLRKVGMAPTSRQPAKVHRGPKRSQHGPATRRTRSVAVRAMMLEMAIWSLVMLMSAAMTSLRSGGNAYLSLM